jgi:hypothetical protein
LRSASARLRTARLEPNHGSSADTRALFLLDAPRHLRVAIVDSKPGGDLVANCLHGTDGVVVV